MPIRTNPAKWRKAVRLILFAAILALVAAATLPGWFPWALKPVLSHFGVSFDEYDRRGYTRFALLNVRGGSGSTRVEARRVDSALPTAWLWRRLFPDTNASPFLTVANWRVSSAGGGAATRGAGNGSTSGTLEELTRLGAGLRTALPLALATNGAVELDAWRFSIPEVDWREGTLSVRIDSLRVPRESPSAWFIGRQQGGATNETFSQRIAVAARFEAESALTVWAGMDGSPAFVRGRLQRGPEAHSWRLTGAMEWLTNRAAFSARFGRTGWWPSEAQLEGQQFHLPAAWLPIRGYDEPTMSLTCRLASARFDLEATGAARPQPTVGNAALPNLDVTLHASGDAELALVDRLEIRGPWLMAQLTNRVGLSWRGGVLTNAAEFQVELDLARVPGLSLSGKMDAAVRAELQTNRVGSASFQVTAANVGVRGLEAERMSVGGRFDWPTLQVDQLEAGFTDGLVLSGSGRADLVASQVLEAKWSIDGDRLARRLPWVRSGSWRAAGRIQGSFTNLAHSGEITVANAEVGLLPPISARTEWLGTNLHFSSTRLEVNAGVSRLSVGGALTVEAAAPPEVRATLSEATLQRGATTLYSLARPCGIHFLGGLPHGASTNWTLAVDAFEWAGSQGQMSVAGSLRWPAEGRWQACAREVALAPFLDFLPPALAGVLVTNLAVDAQWSNGPVHSIVNLAAGVQTPGGRSYGVQGNVRTGERVEFEPLTLMTDSTAALLVTGSLPVSFVPRATKGWVSVDAQQALALRAELTAVDELALPLARLGVLKFTQPRLQLVATGTLDQASSTLAVTAARVEWPGATNDGPRPSLDGLRLDAAIAPGRIELRGLRGTIEGEAVQARGEWPLPPGFWTALLAEGRPLGWSNAQARLQLENARVAAFSRYLPSLLAPEGRLSVDLSLTPGPKLDGLLVLTNAATRPLGAISALRDIAARTRFTQGQATLEEFSGQVGGQPVRAAGQASLSAAGLDYQLTLQGTNVPLARTVEFLLRGDFDLQLAGGPAAPPRLSGQVRLRDGLFVEYARALISNQPQLPQLRPPYFRWTNAPFADWQLDVTLRGDQFLRVRTPVFNGVVSANFKVSGTVREPVATGDARVNSGRVIFPFGTLRVDQAYASFAANDPRGPELLVHASGRNYRYEVRLDVSGRADGARVTLSSTPPLTSEEVLLMLTAGEVPSNESVFSTRTRAGRLATFLGTDFLSRYAGGSRSGERLIVSTGENISDEGKTTYSVEYRMTDRWSLVGEYDRFSAINAAIKWRILTR